MKHFMEQPLPQPYGLTFCISYAFQTAILVVSSFLQWFTTRAEHLTKSKAIKEQIDFITRCGTIIAKLFTGL